MVWRTPSEVPSKTIDPLEAFVQAASLHAQGRLREAGQLYEIAAKADDRHFDAVYRLGLVRLQQGRYGDAAALFHRTIKLDKHSAEAQHHLGIALTGLERFEEAIPRYEKALVLNPNLAEAHNNFGYTLQRLDRHEDAAAHYEDALAINPLYAEARNNLGNALQALGRFEEAIEQFQKALAIKPNYLEAYNNLGNLFAKLDRYDEAIAEFQKVLAINSKNFEAHQNLGNALGAIGRYEDAIVAFERALSIDPNHVEALSGLGDLLETLGRPEAAIPHCSLALALQPKHVKARNTLGAALRAMGRIDDAIVTFEQAIASDPRKTAAYYNLASSQRMTADNRYFSAMRELAQDIESLSSEQQEYLHFALAKSLSDIGDHRQSIGHLLQGNSLKRQRIAYDEPKVLDRFSRIRRVFSAELMRKKARFGDPSTLPVFIIGMPRSGTTLIEQILASHPNVFGAGELQEIRKLAADIKLPDGTVFPEATLGISASQVRQLGERYLNSIRSFAPNAERITDKLPANFAHAGLIHILFPNARIIHARRDPRDTALSCFSIVFARDSQEHTYDLVELGRYYRAYQELMRHWETVLPPGVMLEVQYENVVSDLEKQARRIVDHCALGWDDACLAFHKTDRLVHTASVTQVREPIYASSVARWRPYEAMLQPFLQALEGQDSA